MAKKNISEKIYRILHSGLQQARTALEFYISYKCCVYSTVGFVSQCCIAQRGFILVLCSKVGFHTSSVQYSGVCFPVVILRSITQDYHTSPATLIRSQCIADALHPHHHSHYALKKIQTGATSMTLHPLKKHLKRQSGEKLLIRSQCIADALYQYHAC